jgi:type IV pilus assembly protein PilM
LTLGQLEGKVAGAILPIFRIVTEEVKKAVHYYQTEEKGEAPKVVILSGGGAGLPDMSVNLAKTLNSEVIIANPFSKVSVDPNLARNIIPYAPLYSVCVGLALREE